MIILSTLYYIFMVLFCITFMLISAIALLLFLPFDPARRVVHEISRFMVWVFFGIPPAWRQSIEGLENIDPEGRYVIVMNHNSMLDIPAAYAMPLNFRWVSKQEVFQIPFFGQFLFLHGDIAIQRGRGAAAMGQVIRDGKKWLQRGASIAIFPEGTRSKTGEIGRFKQGAFNLALEAGVPILPVVLDGTSGIIVNKHFCWRTGVKVRVLPSVELRQTEDLKEQINSIREDMVLALDQMK